MGALTSKIEGFHALNEEIQLMVVGDVLWKLHDEKEFFDLNRETATRDMLVQDALEKLAVNPAGAMPVVEVRE